MLRYFFILFLSLFSFSLFAQLQLENDTSFEQISIHDFASYYESNQNLSLAEVQKIPETDFKRLENGNTNFGFTENQFWIRFQVDNQTQENKTYFLETARPITDIANLYVLRNNSMVAFFKNGDLIPFQEKSVKHRKTIFKIELPAQTLNTYYLQLESDGEVISLPLVLRSTENLINVSAYEQLIFGIFYGILTLAAIIYLFFFFGIKNRSFLYYGLYVIFIGLMQFSLDGYFHQYFLPNGGFFSDRAVLIFASISAIFLGKYTATFLDIKQYNRWIYKGYTLVYIGSGLVLFALFFVPSALPYCYPVANAVGFLVLLLIISGLVSIYRKTKKVDVFFFTGIFFLVAGFVIFILNNFSLITNSFLTENSPKFGTGLEIIFLSLSMSNLIRNLREERENLQFIALQKSEEMNELKLYFLSNISHELRTPLNIILNLTDRIASRTRKKKVKVDCEIVTSSTKNLLSSVNDILDFSKIEKDEFVLENKSFDALELLQEINKSYSYLAENHQLDFEYIDNQLDRVQVMGDYNRLRQVLSNLLNNAIKFTPKGKITFEVNWHVLSLTNLELQIKISDTGIGISKQKIDGVFDSFNQETINNKRKYGGLGLGLYIVKKIIDESNGKISIESILGEGTVCTVSIPFEKVVLDEPKVETDARNYNLLQKFILVAEDNLLNQLVLKKILKEWQNTEVHFANNGLECLEKLKLKHYDIILMDLQMPEMDGYEATICIRNGEAGDAFKNIPIIAVTADIMESTKKRVFDLGINNYHSKPIEKQLLFEQIYELVKD